MNTQDREELMRAIELRLKVVAFRLVMIAAAIVLVFDVFVWRKG